MLAQCGGLRYIYAGIVQTLKRAVRSMLLDTPICDFGWQAPAFDLKTPKGARHSLTSLRGERGLLICFICNHCPYVKAIITRLVADAKTLRQDGINTVAIMSNDYQNVAADSPEQMQIFAEKHGFDFPYLVDEQQALAQAYGAICTPDFFGLNAKLRLQYRGRLDDLKMGANGERNAELLEAMRQIAKTGAGPVAQTPAVGCSIKWRGE
mgnify:FL=1